MQLIRICETHRRWNQGMRFSVMICSLVVANMWLGLGLVQGQIRKVGNVRLNGKVVRKTNHSLFIQDEDRKVIEVLYQDEGIDRIPIGEGVARVPANIRVKGSVPFSAIREGIGIQFTGILESKGKITQPVKEIRVLPSKFSKMKLSPLSLGSQSYPVEAEISGVVKKIKDNKIQIEVPRSDYAKNKKVVLTIAEDAQISVKEKSMREVIEGDSITKLLGIKFSGGEIIATNIDVELSNAHKNVQMDPDDVLMLKYRHLDDQPKAPREVRSEHFIVKTDLSERSTKILIDKLERMYSIISKYYGVKGVKQPIYCYVADDLGKWTHLMADLQDGLDSIQGQAGVTVTMRRGREIKSTVYSCGDHKVVQHEAVHCFCSLLFGSAGPVWYAEGMAELGCYWRPGEKEVNLDPIVIRYLTTADKRALTDLVKPGQVTGDSWKAYAWRWALCYMLVNNKNYAKDFYDLGWNLMKQRSRGVPEGQGRKSFYSVFKDSAPEIIFEYEQFLEGLDNGYRADLCEWNWKKKPYNLRTKKMSKAVVNARAGWQPSRAKLEEGKQYELVAKGKWSTALAQDVSADGNDDGNGKLIGAVLVVTKLKDKVLKRSYKLSETLELGKRVVFTAPASGHLYLRCAGKMSQVAKNQGKLTVFVRRKK